MSAAASMMTDSGIILGLIDKELEASKRALFDHRGVGSNGGEGCFHCLRASDSVVPVEGGDQIFMHVIIAGDSRYVLPSDDWWKQTLSNASRKIREEEIFDLKLIFLAFQMEKRHAVSLILESLDGCVNVLAWILFCFREGESLSSRYIFTKNEAARILFVGMVKVLLPDDYRKFGFTLSAGSDEKSFDRFRNQLSARALLLISAFQSKEKLTTQQIRIQY